MRPYRRFSYWDGGRNDRKRHGVFENVDAEPGVKPSYFFYSSSRRWRRSKLLKYSSQSANVLIPRSPNTLCQSSYSFGDKTNSFVSFEYQQRYCGKPSVIQPINTVTQPRPTADSARLHMPSFIRSSMHFPTRLANGKRPTGRKKKRRVINGI